MYPTDTTTHNTSISTLDNDFNLSLASRSAGTPTDADEDEVEISQDDSEETTLRLVETTPLVV